MWEAVYMRIYIVSAYPTVRAGLRALVQERAGWAVAGESSPAALPVSNTSDESPPAVRDPIDVVLADLDDMVAPDVLSALIRATQPHGGIVAIGGGGTASDLPRSLDPSTLSGTFGPLGFGLLPRDATADEIVAAVDAVGRGLIVLDRTVARRVFAATASGATSDSAAARSAEARFAPGEMLTARESEVLQLLAEGLPNKIIAARLRVSEHTAKFHVASIMTKLGAASRTEAVTLAARRGLLIL
jgi:DNA-binding NarL/FixJ family response regulator